MKAKLTRELIAMRAAKELFEGAVVNLGIGIPTLVSGFVPEGLTIVFQTENGALGFGPLVGPEDFARLADVDLVNAGGQYLIPVPGMCFFASLESFAMIRGGHIDITILGAIEVSESGDLANWMIPQRGVGNIGGGMDLAFNAKKVIVTMEHVAKDGRPKIVKKCLAPLTAPGCVDLIITDIAVIEVAAEGLALKEIVSGWTLDEVQALTGPRLIVEKPPKIIEL